MADDERTRDERTRELDISAFPPAQRGLVGQALGSHPSADRYPQDVRQSPAVEPRGWLEDRSQPDDAGRFGEVNRFNEIGRLDEIGRFDEIGRLNEISRVDELGQADEISRFGEIDRPDKIDRPEPGRQYDHLGRHGQPDPAPVGSPESSYPQLSSRPPTAAQPSSNQLSSAQPSTRQAGTQQAGSSQPGSTALGGPAAGEPTSPWRTGDETLVLPVFMTGGARATSDDLAAAKPASAPPATPAATTSGPKLPHPDRLPSDERNMLIFVAALLALGTLAIVAMASFGH